MTATDQLAVYAGWRARLKTDWRACKVAHCFLPPDIIAFMIQDHGPETTLGNLSDKTDAELVRSPNIGVRSRTIIREYLRVLDGGHRDPD